MDTKQMQDIIEYQSRVIADLTTGTSPKANKPPYYVTDEVSGITRSPLEFFPPQSPPSQFSPPQSPPSQLPRSMVSRPDLLPSPPSDSFENPSSNPPKLDLKSRLSQLNPYSSTLDIVETLSTASVDKTIVHDPKAKYHGTPYAKLSTDFDFYKWATWVYEKSHPNALKEVKANMKPYYDQAFSVFGAYRFTAGSHKGKFFQDFVYSPEAPKYIKWLFDLIERPNELYKSVIPDAHRFKEWYDKNS